MFVLISLMPAIREFFAASVLFLLLSSTNYVICYFNFKAYNIKTVYWTLFVFRRCARIRYSDWIHRRERCQLESFLIHIAKEIKVYWRLLDLSVKCRDSCNESRLQSKTSTQTIVECSSEYWVTKNVKSDDQIYQFITQPNGSKLSLIKRLSSCIACFNGIQITRCFVLTRAVWRFTQNRERERSEWWDEH